ncbi:Transmembrane emp24 domain-containing protein p24beta2 [Dichanthelium oligosanthes]|uniref:Transmembrane emp24 domain-containing protein p24beta2 n=1 Tax=Dichanthelium oligosanthes TaxID=888268 RepID=A0A1E5VHW4_9POAL|nr:Transmembrane emp24 domain-containing protein p24beta2 [Dichanthelium oligosanthes]
MLLLRDAAAIRFVIDREECFSHSVDYEGDTVHVSFVVIKADTPWHYTQDGVDLVVKDPRGDQIHDSRDKISDKFEFTVRKRDVHRFCFTNKSPYHETVDFDVHVGHFSYFDQHAKDAKHVLLLKVQCFFLPYHDAVNENMSRRAVHKALFESAGLVAASVVQVFLMHRLFERKLGTSRV